MPFHHCRTSAGRGWSDSSARDLIDIKQLFTTETRRARSWNHGFTDCATEVCAFGESTCDCETATVCSPGGVGHVPRGTSKWPGNVTPWHGCLVRHSGKEPASHVQSRLFAA